MEMRNRIILSLLVVLLGLPARLGAQQPLQLSLKEAVDAALEPDGNTRIQLAREAIRQAEAHAAQVRAELLPDINASIGQQSRTLSLTESGLRSADLPRGFELPSIVGPFNTFEARGTLTQKLFDLSSIRRYQAAKVGTQAAKEESESAKEKTAADVARAYLLAVRAQALVETAQANVQLSDALLRLANSQKEAGTGTGIDITRAQVQLANNRQLLLVAEADFTKSRLQLLKTLGVGLDVQLALTDQLAYAPSPVMSLEQAIASAHESLAELRAQRKHEESASLKHKATSLERLPSIVGFADYGTVGLSANHTAPTRTFGASIQIPIFDGGRRDARRAESRSVLNEERIRTADLEEEVELRIRIALDAVHSADAQVQAAESGLALSEDELQQAQRRYQAGVGTSIEVTDAQTRLQRGRENRISAIFNHALARIDLAASTGNIHGLVTNWR
jgi:outer membrane protein